MACSSVQNIKIQPVNVTWEIEEKICLQAVADVSDSLAGTYFKLMGTHYVWFDDGVAVDPAPAGLTGLAVSYTTDGAASVIAGEIAAVVDADANFSATASDDTVEIFAAAVGKKELSVDVDSGMVISREAEGGSLDLGLLDGDIESSFEEQLLDITAHQTGTTVLTALRQGVSAEISLVMKESDVAKYKEIFASSGGESFTPVGGTEVFGWGTSRQGDNVIVQARRLRLHGVNASDNSEDLTFWKAYPKPESIVYSGENPKTLSVTFGIYRDEDRDERISYFMFGDATQTGL